MQNAFSSLLFSRSTDWQIEMIQHYAAYQDTPLSISLESCSHASRTNTEKTTAPSTQRLSVFIATRQHLIRLNETKRNRRTFHFGVHEYQKSSNESSLSCIAIVSRGGVRKWRRD